MNTRAPVQCPTFPGLRYIGFGLVANLAPVNLRNGSLQNVLNCLSICLAVLVLRRLRRHLKRFRPLLVRWLLLFLLPLLLSLPLGMQLCLLPLGRRLCLLPLGSRLCLWLRACVAGFCWTLWGSPGPGPSVAIPQYLNGGSVTINMDWVRQHLSIVVGILVNHDCLALWPDICAELSAQNTRALQAGRFPEPWLLSRAGRPAVLLVVATSVRTYIDSDLWRNSDVHRFIHRFNRLKALAPVSASPAVSVSGGHSSLLALFPSC
jgi:hypothetical protein